MFKNFLALLAGCLFSILVFFVIETFLLAKDKHFLNLYSEIKNHYKSLFTTSNTYLRNDYYENLYFEASANEYEALNDKTFIVNLDDLRRRVTLDQGEKADKFAIFLGCSFTFGDGLSDDETLPYFFGKKTEEYQAYNYALSGSAPNMFLYLLSKRNLSEEVKQKSGVVYYFFINNQTLRATTHFSTMSFAWPAPKYVFNDKKELYLETTVSTDMKLKRFFAKSAAFSNLRYLMDSETITPEMRELTCEIINQIGKKVDEQFDDTKFITVLYPEESNSEIGDCLRAKGVEVLDFSHVKRDPILKNHWDGFHPSKLENDNLSDILLEHINARR